MKQIEALAAIESLGHPLFETKDVAAVLGKPSARAKVAYQDEVLAKEIERIAAEVAQERLSLVPLAFYFKDGRVKVELALARGRRKADKRNAMAERDAQRDMQRAMGRQAKGRTD